MFSTHAEAAMRPFGFRKRNISVSLFTIYQPPPVSEVLKILVE